MELKVTQALDEQGNVIVDNFIITEIVDGVDALDNPIKIKGESGQHTLASIEGNIISAQKQIEEAEKQIEKWTEYKNAISNV